MTMTTKLTKKQEQIYKTLQSMKGFATAQEIHTQTPNIDLTTVYRALEKFEKENLVQKIILNNGEAVYEASKHKHHHIICTSCNKIHHVEIQQKIISEVENISHLKPESIEITIKGICK